MARPRTDRRIVDEIMRIVLDRGLPDAAKTAGGISGRLKKWAKRTSFNGSLPSLRQVSRIKAGIKDKESKPDADDGLLGYRSFYFPESMEKGDLDWEAAPAALELLAWAAAAIPDEYWERPTIAFVQWYWRISVAAPDAPIGIKVMMAGLLLAPGDRRGDVVQRVIEACLLHSVWRPQRHDWETRLLKVKVFLSTAFGDDEDLETESLLFAELLMKELRHSLEQDQQ